MSAPDDKLAALAEGVADGRTPDWSAAAAAVSSDRERAVVAQLQSIAEIARAHAVAAGPDSGDHEAGAPSPPFSWGPLQVIEQIGRGRFGRVYRARDPSPDRDVALKILDRTEADDSQ